jgi:hypothetical protein
VCECFADRLGERVGVLAVCSGHEDYELVAADADDGADLAQAAIEEPREPASTR